MASSCPDWSVAVVKFLLSLLSNVPVHKYQKNQQVYKINEIEASLPWSSLIFKKG